MLEPDVAIFVVVALSFVSFLLYGRARAYGVSRALAKRTVIEIWVAVAACVVVLAVGSRLVPAARLAPWGVLQADARGQAIAAMAGVLCLIVVAFVLSRVRTLINAGQPPQLGVGRDTDSSEDVEK